MTEAASIVRAEAVRLLRSRPDNERGEFVLEAGDKVLVGMATRAEAWVLTIDRSEAGGMDVMRRLGFELREPSALEKIKRTKKA